MSGAAHPRARARPAACPPHPRSRFPPGRSGSGTTFSAVLPQPSQHRTGPRMRPSRPAARGSGPGYSAAPALPSPAAPRASRSMRRRPAAARTGPEKAAPGGSGPWSRERGSEGVSRGSSASWRPSFPRAHLPPLAGPAPPVRPPLPPSGAAVGLSASGTLGPRAQAQVQAGLWDRGSGLGSAGFWGWPRDRHGLSPFHRLQL